MVTTTRGVSARRLRPASPFNRGILTEHCGEIEMGKEMAQAAYLLYGDQECRRAIREAPSSLFRRFRYGRRVDPLGGRDWLILALHNSPYIGKNKARDEHIMTPSSPDWRRRLPAAVKRLMMAPRYAPGWSATAEALDDLGYAIAESIAVLELLGFRSDDAVPFRLVRRW